MALRHSLPMRCLLCIIVLSSVSVVLLPVATLSSPTPQQYSSDGFQYQVVTDWPDWPADANATSISAVAVQHPTESITEVHVCQRNSFGLAPVFVFSTNGTFLRTWGVGLISTCHGISSSPDGSSIWVTDVGDHTVKQFHSSNGSLITTLGTPNISGNGTDPLQFDNVADVAFTKGGNLIISDGDGGTNNRVLCLHPDNFTLLWIVGNSTAGHGLYQFNSPHSVSVDSADILWVADRGNNRTMMYANIDTQAPTFLGEFNSSCFYPGKPWGISYLPSMNNLPAAMAIADGTASRLLLVRDVSNEGDCLLFTANVTTASTPHMLDVDQVDGDIYLAMVGSPSAVFKYESIPV